MDDSQFIYIDSDTDSDRTVVFDAKEQRIKPSVEHDETLPSYTDSAAKIEPSLYNRRQLSRVKTKFMSNFLTLRKASEKLHRLIKTNTQLLTFVNASAQTSMSNMSDIYKRWDSGILSLRSQHDQIVAAVRGKKTGTKDALLAEIKRKRWCCVCLKPALIWDLDGLTATYFCGMDCQLAHIDP